VRSCRAFEAVPAPSARVQEHGGGEAGAGPRPSAARRGYGSRWRRARAAYLARNPLCVRCQAAGYIGSSTVVDHVVPHRGDAALFWDEANWAALCKPCHDAKTAREGRWG
jgi:5-methylcytosine-specific restriction enzyme A